MIINVKGFYMQMYIVTKIIPQLLIFTILFVASLPISTSANDVDKHVIYDYSDVVNYNRNRFQLLPADTNSHNSFYLTTSIDPADFPANTLLLKTKGAAVTVYINGVDIYSKNILNAYHPFSDIQWHFITLPLTSDEPVTLSIKISGSNPYIMGKLDYLSISTPMQQTARTFFFDLPIIMTAPVILLLIIVLMVYCKSDAIYRKLYYRFIGYSIFLFIWMILTSCIRQTYWGNNAFLSYMQYIMTYMLPMAANIIFLTIIEPASKYHIILIEYILSAGLLITAALDNLAYTGLYLGLKYLYFLLLITEVYVLWLIAKSAAAGNKYSRAALLFAVSIPLLSFFDWLNHFISNTSISIYLYPLSYFFTAFLILSCLKWQITKEKLIAKNAARLEYITAVATEKAERDYLTSCYNRNKLDKTLAELIGRPAMRFSFIIFDIDDFKKFNDNYDHKAGDKVLKLFAKLVLPETNKHKSLFRWGGEEFVIICQNQSLNEAIDFANHIRQKFVKTDNSFNTPITVSAGVSEWHGSSDTPENLFKRADTALYQAKAAGKNCVRSNQKDGDIL